MYRSPAQGSRAREEASLPRTQLLRGRTAGGLSADLNLDQGVIGEWNEGSRSLKSRVVSPSLDLISPSSWNEHRLLSEGFGDGFSGKAKYSSIAEGSSSREWLSGQSNGEEGVLFSLPKASLLQVHDAVPCKIRAKRGCATHPRSIAERERRSRISERIRKLQELMPKMEKPLSTAEMLDLALDYIRELQEQVKTLSESNAECTCLGNNGV